MKSLFHSWLLLVLLATVASAKTITIAGENFSIDIPDAWTQQARTDLLLFASDAGGASALAIRKFPNENDEVINTAFIRDMKQGMVAEGRSIGTNVAIEAESPLTLGGAPAYLIQSRMIPPHSKSIAVRTYVLAAEHRTGAGAAIAGDGAVVSLHSAAPASGGCAGCARLSNRPGDWRGAGPGRGGGSDQARAGAALRRLW
jgi:hypothetical protein